MSIQVRFWGVRGSIPCPGPTTVKYGGNTTCIELRFLGTDRIIIIDAGSGARALGDFMMQNDFPKGPIKADLLFSHTHWDHIMGFPFFTPIFVPGTKLNIYGPVTYEEDSLSKIVGGQLTYRYFPVRQVELAAQLDYHHLKEGKFDLGDGITLISKYLNHPLLCLGYRFEYQGKALCTAYDTEPFQNLFCTDPADPSYDEAMATEGEMVAREQNLAIEQFMKGADLVIHDTQYTQAEYDSGRRGWGHSPVEYAVAAANRVGVKSLSLFHHDPQRTDDQIDELAKTFESPNAFGSTEVFFAREGQEIIL